MSQFRSGNLSNKVGQCRRIAGQIAGAATEMGLIASTDASRLSASHYVYVAASDDLEAEAIKIRCSDHDDKNGGSDWQHWAGTCPSVTIARLAAHFGRAVPAKYTAAAYDARSASASAGSKTASSGRQQAEAAMLRTVTTLLSAEAKTGPIIAGRIVDAAFPAIPKAQRSRLANAASSAVTKNRAIAAAAGDETALLKLAARYDEARIALRALAGSERFAALRPAGFPRTIWKA